VTVGPGSKSRPLRVFWDVKCLKTGEPWEEGFIKAICSSAVICPVLSRGTFAMQGRWHDVSKLQEDSACDNVVRS